MQADILTKIVLPIALFLIMFGLGLSLQRRDFARVLTEPKAIILGLFGQLVLLPALALAIAMLLELPGEIAVGLIIIALAPGGATSNMFTYLARAETSLSISLTAVISLITPFTIPIFTVMAMQHFMGSETAFSLPVGQTVIQLLVITVVPVLLGMGVRARWPHLAARMEVALKWFSIAFLLLIVALIVLKNSANMGSFFAEAGFATALLNGLALLLGYQLGARSGLDHSQSVCLGFEVGIQNGTVALLVAGTLIGNSVMMIPAVTYSLIMFVSGALFAWLMKRQLGHAA